MLNPVQLAKLELGIYHAADVAWDYCEVGTTDNNVVFGMKLVEGIWYVVFRGSRTPLDWLRDLHFLPTYRKDIGIVPRGFAVGMDAAWAQIQKIAGPGARYFFVGHSLGAARATICAALALTQGVATVAGRCVWGEPRTGGSRLRDIIRSGLAGLPNVSYRNGPDPVGDLPYRLLWLNYTQPGKVTYFHLMPSSHSWDPARWHSMELYAAAMHELAM